MISVRVSLLNGTIRYGDWRYVATVREICGAWFHNGGYEKAVGRVRIIRQ